MYRQLTPSEIKTLEKQGCSAENWEELEVSASFSTDTVKNVQFAGKVRIGALKGKVKTAGGMEKPSALQYARIENCTIGDRVYISFVSNLVNYTVENDVAIENVGNLIASKTSSFGNGTEIDVLNEGGGRELPIFDRLSAQIAYLLVFYRHNKALIEKLKKQVATYIEMKKASHGTLGEHSIITQTPVIIDVNIGAYSTITAASKLENGTIVSNRFAPVEIGNGVVAENFIVLSGSKIDNSAIISNTFVGQGVRIGKQYSAENSVFFANCEAYHGEACSIFAGPYTVSHHKSSLLIAGLFSFYNAGSGTNQSNHMYKLGPVHQGIVERGSKTGSFSYMLWPCRVGAFSVVMDKHGGNFDTSELPFSYISVQDGKSVVTPAMNLFTVGTSRDSKKWPKRDRRNDPEKLDLITFDLFNPCIVQKIMDGSDLLSRLNEATPKTKEFATHKGIHINRLMLRTSKRYYDLAVKVYLAQNIVDKLVNVEFKTIAEIRNLLLPLQQSKQNRWIDLAGMIADKERIEALTDSIVSDKLRSLDETLAMFAQIDANYNEHAYSWCVAALKNSMNIDVSMITKEELLLLLSDFKVNASKLNKMILKDAEKEFDQLSRIGFGIDGGENEIREDFEAIRGTYDMNSFVHELKDKIESIEKVCDELSRKVEEIN